MRTVRIVLLAAVVVALTTPPAFAHEERESQFPPGGGETPTYRPIADAAAVLVVCKPDSAERIADIADPAVRAANESLLADCAFEHLQAAVDAVQVQRTNIYVLPGHYREEPSWAPPCTEGYGGGIVTYDLIVSCGEVLNLVTIAGDDPADPDIVCDNQLCHLQIEGTGSTPEDVLFTGGFGEDGDWIKHNVLKADRADGFYLRNMTFELARENSVYIHETDGYAIDRVVARYNDLYGILTFTSDHGVMKDCEAHHNGDSGIYPGSAADVNGTSMTAPPLERWSVEIYGCDTHHNALGFSGTAGNSVYFHDNLVHHNSAGYVTDSFVGGHPGMPQDHAWIEHNQIYSNNEFFYADVQGPNPVCHASRPADVGYERGVVCPAFGVPTGTGVLIAGGNYNLVRNNDIYDNWRYGVMLFWVPAVIRGETDPAAQLDTSNNNRYIDNRFGVHPAGVNQPNSLDVWWDDQGLGNCWEGNTSVGPVTHNATLPILPDCTLASVLPASNAVKSASLLFCSAYNRNSNPSPDNCDWFTAPREPVGRQMSPDEIAALAAAPLSPAAPAPVPGAAVPTTLPATGGLPPGAVAASLGAAVVAWLLVRRVRARS